MKKLRIDLESLCVFRAILKDRVMAALQAYLAEPTNAAYAAFVSTLYEVNGGDLATHVRTLCENDENVYVRTVGAGREVPPYIQETLEAELAVLQRVAELSPEALCAPLQYEGFLPRFAKGSVDLAGCFAYRMQNIGKYGYGIYAQNPMFYVGEEGEILPVRHPDPVALSDLVDYERERKIIYDNTLALLSGKPAANVLLTGDAGTGKSSTVKAVGNALFEEGLRIIEVRKDQLRAIPKLEGELAENPLKFVLFIDDLSFLKDDDSFNALKAVLEGSVSAKSKNVVIYATSNRRHVIKERFSDREGDDVHRNDTLQEMISLSERFGIHVSFQKPNKDTYLHIVHHLAEECGIDMPKEEMDLLAERFALERGGRSARLARQFIDGLLSKME